MDFAARLAAHLALLGDTDARARLTDTEVGEIHADLAAMPLDKERSDGVKSIVAKEQIVADFGRSPDIYDAIALCKSSTGRTCSSPVAACP